jgi:hypothetical protein
LHIRGNGHATLEDHIDLVHLIIIVMVSLTMFSSSRLLHRGFLWHLLMIQKSLAFIQTVSCGAIDFTPLLGGLLLAIPVIVTIPAIYCIDLPIFLLLLL